MDTEISVERSSLHKNTITNTNLNNFLENWDSDYYERIENIDLFNPQLTGQWTKAQKNYFVRVFYHARGHFRDFLWHLGNFAPDKSYKDIILENIAEEFNGNDLSHEQYYLDFARNFGIDVSDELIEENYNLPMIDAFNKAHIKWLHSHDWEYCFAAFSAYERLDTADYELLSTLCGQKEHKFFTIHRQAQHFSKTIEKLQLIWENSSAKVETAFEYIAMTQTTMWKKLSDAVFNYPTRETATTSNTEQYC